MKRSILLFIFFGNFILLYAQKKPLDHSVYDGWQHMSEKIISNDGKWVVFTVDPQQGDNELVIESADAKYRKAIPRGYNAQVTADSRYLILKIKPFYKDTREAKIKKKKSADMPKDSFALLELGKELIWKAANVKSYKTPQLASGWVAYQLEKSTETSVRTKSADSGGNKLADSLKYVIDSLTGVIEVQSKKKIKKKDDDLEDETINPYGIATDSDGDETGGATAETGTDLVLRNIESGGEIVFYGVLEYYFNKSGEKLLIEQARDLRDAGSKKMVVLYDLKEGKTLPLSRGGNDFRGFAMTDDGMQVAYMAERDAAPGDIQKFYTLWYYRQGMDSAELLTDRYATGMKLGMTISEFGTVSFSKSGHRIFFGTAPIPLAKDTALVEFEHPKLDIWNYKDDYLQTVQTFPGRLKNDLQANYLAVYDLPLKTFRQLGTPEIPQVLQTNEGDGDTFIGITDFGKRIESQWNGITKKDIYAIDVNTGGKKLVKENLLGQVYASSAGRYILWYDRVLKNYFTWDGGVIRNITDDIKVPFYIEEWDMPQEPANYGVMGWHKNDSAVYIYDRYDIWKIDPLKNIKPLIVTKDGRKNRDVFRYLQVDKDEKFISPSSSWYFSSLNLDTKNMALWKYRPGMINNVMLNVTGFRPMKFDNFQKAKNKDQFIVSAESFINPPDLYSFSLPVGSLPEPAPDWAKVTRLSFLNSRQSGYNWGTAELFTWKAYNGKDASGIVFKPEDFDPSKKYPLICYFYEKLSDRLNDYREPAPIRSAVNVPFFVSRGYIIFMPDISYKIGYPGQSAYDYIVSGARALVKRGWVDSTRMALQGHSWGGYQAAIIATMTPLFKAVWAGAPVANMTSSYGGIRWESGVSRQFQYEKTQSRIGGSLWEKLPLYLENSPLFQLDKVTAPMVIMANDADGAVPWYQGIELFNGLRRLGKKVWMFNYNGQGHGLTQRQDMLDYQVRMQQFFDWILKGEHPARWITEGVPAVNKGKDWGLDEEERE